MVLEEVKGALYYIFNTKDLNLDIKIILKEEKNNEMYCFKLM